jgi:hypothetical protein
MNSMRILKGFFLILLVLISSLQGISQTTLFNDTLRPIGPGGYDFSSICEDDSFYYLNGGVNHYTSHWQHYVVKMDKTLQIEKAIEISDSSWHYFDFTFNSIAINGRVIITCPQVFNNDSAYGRIIAYDKHSLDTLWTKAIAHPDTQFAAQPGATPFSELTTVTATPDGGFILTGNYNKYCITGNIRSFLLKIDSVGNVQWRKTYDDVTSLYSLALAPNGGYAFISWLSGIHFVLTDSLGNILWKKPKQNFTTLGKPSDLTYDGSGGFICIVYYQYGGTVTNALYGVNVFRVDIATQQLSWDKTFIPFHHVESYSLHEDLGITKLPDNSFVIYSSVSDIPGFSGFILKLDQNADSVWCKNFFFGPPNQGECQLNDLLPTDDGGFLGVGFYVPNGGDIAAWMFKTDANGYVGFEESLPLTTSAIRVFPNPAKEAIHIDLSTTQEATLLNVYNLSGRLVAVMNIESPATLFKLDLQSFDPGMYFFELVGDSGRLGSGKFLKVE